MGLLITVQPYHVGEVADAAQAEISTARLRLALKNCCSDKPVRVLYTGLALATAEIVVKILGVKAERAFQLERGPEEVVQAWEYVRWIDDNSKVLIVITTRPHINQTLLEQKYAEVRGYDRRIPLSDGEMRGVDDDGAVFNILMLKV